MERSKHGPRVKARQISRVFGKIRKLKDFDEGNDGEWSVKDDEGGICLKPRPLTPGSSYEPWKRENAAKTLAAKP